MKRPVRYLVAFLAAAAVVAFALVVRSPWFAGPARPAATAETAAPAQPRAPGAAPAVSAGNPRGGGQRPAIPVTVAAVVERPLRDEVNFVAAVEPSVATTVGAEVDGRVIDLPVREGDAVAGGQTVVARIEAGPREIQLREARAAVARAREELAKLQRGYRAEEIEQRAAEVAERKAIMDRAEQDHLRAQRLHRDQMIATADRDRAESEYLAAKQAHQRALAAHRMMRTGPRPEEIAQAAAELAQAEARADRIADEIRRATVRAAITGYVVKKHVDVGVWLRPGDRIVDLIALDPVFITGPLGEREVPRLRLGQAATVSVDAYPGRSFGGRVTAIVPEADPASRTFPVRITVANPGGLLKAGMFARVAVQAGESRQGLFVPKDAVVRRGGQQFVFVVRGDAADQVKVETGVEDGALVEVRGASLAAGQRTVTLGNEFLQTGMKIAIQ
jgi:multidrug efflux pump subunit AcrA (membrane-fusion protein)